VVIAAFLKNVMLVLFYERNLKTTAALGNDGCPSATTFACIVYIDR
jgi:hypothetical protein